MSSRCCKVYFVSKKAQEALNCNRAKIHNLPGDAQLVSQAVVTTPEFMDGVCYLYWSAQFKPTPHGEPWSRAIAVTEPIK